MVSIGSRLTSCITCTVNPISYVNSIVIVNVSCAKVEQSISECDEIPTFVDKIHTKCDWTIAQLDK